MRTIQEGWESYRKLVLPANASEVQVSECRMAFYAGATHLLYMITGVADDDVSEDAGVEILEGLHQELQLFRETL